MNGVALSESVSGSGSVSFSKARYPFDSDSDSDTDPDHVSRMRHTFHPASPNVSIDWPDCLPNVESSYPMNGVASSESVSGLGSVSFSKAGYPFDSDSDSDTDPDHGEH